MRELQGRIPVRLWVEDLEPGAMEQVENLARLPFAFHHVAIMPDSHRGYGMVIGGVLATREVVLPNGVGVDIGCGMVAVKTSIEARRLDRPTLEQLVARIRKRIPTGFRWHAKPVNSRHMDGLGDPENLPVVRRHHEDARKQLGTLGGGNHFIELQKDREGWVWVMIHSGSRNLGKQVAEHYNRCTASFDGYRGWEVPRNYQLGFLPLDSSAGRSYLREMQYCIDFAVASRLHMLEAVEEILAEELGPLTTGDVIHAIHNYAAEETHFGVEVIVHRKGAIRVRSGELGIVPGSQGTPSYIVRGLGNPESFSSCAHGAGRCLGRRQAVKKLDLERERERLEDLEVVHALRRKKDLDEAPGAYKDIAEVMRRQHDLVETVEELLPMAVVKG